MENLPPGKVLVSDQNGAVSASNVTAAELVRLSGLQVNVAQALEGKQSRLQGPAVESAPTVDRVVVTAHDGRLISSTVSSSALNRLVLLDTGGSTLSELLDGKHPAMAIAAPLVLNQSVLSLPVASAVADGYLAASDFAAFHSKQNALPTASAAASGILSSADWQNFNGKEPAIQGAASSVTQSLLAPERLLVSDAQGKIGVSLAAASKGDMLATLRSSVQEQIDAKQNTLTGALSSALANFSPSVVVQTDASGKLQASGVPAGKLAFIASLTADVQTQLAGKQATATGSCTSTLNSNLAGNAVVITNSGGKFSASSISSSTLNYLSGLSGNVQNALNAVAITTGTYIPTVGDGSEWFTASTARGSFQKWGNLVHVAVLLTWTSKGAADGASDVRVTLPFACQTNAGGSFAVGRFSGQQTLSASVSQGDAFLVLREQASVLPVSSMQNSGTVQISGTYFFA